MVCRLLSLWQNPEWEPEAEAGVMSPAEDRTQAFWLWLKGTVNLLDQCETSRGGVGEVEGLCDLNGQQIHEPRGARRSEQHNSGAGEFRLGKPGSELFILGVFKHSTVC